MFKKLFKGKDKDDKGKGAIPEEDKVCREDFDTLKLLGKGSFGKVLLVRKKGGSDDGKAFAMKMIQKDQLLQNQRVQDVFTERGVLRRADNPFLCKLHYTFQTEHKLFFIMDLYRGGDLDCWLNKQPAKKLPRHVAQLYAAETLLALQYLHNNGIIYRDLKPENILMGDDGHLALSDFGLAKDFGNFSLDSVDMRTASFVGSPFYVAPDVLKQKQYAKEIDYWSFGILVFRMLVGRPPFLGRSMKEVFDNILYQELRFSQSNPIDAVAEDIISKFLKKDPAQRLKGDKARDHDFWKEISWEKVLQKDGGTPEGWVAPEPLKLDELAAQAAAQSGSADSPRAVAATPANAGPLAKDDQELFSGFTYQGDGSPVAAQSK